MAKIIEDEFTIVFCESESSGNDHPTGKTLTIFLSPDLYQDWYPKGKFWQRTYPMNDETFAAIKVKMLEVGSILEGMSYKDC
jgi:hypothetical protein